MRELVYQFSITPQFDSSKTAPIVPDENVLREEVQVPVVQMFFDWLRAFRSRELPANWKEDLSTWDLLLSLPSFYASKLPSSKRFAAAADALSEHYNELCYWLAGDTGEVGTVSDTEYWKKFAKDKTAYKRVKDYLIDKDKRADGLIVEQNGIGLRTWRLVASDGRILAEFANHAEAVAALKKNIAFRGAKIRTHVVNESFDLKKRSGETVGTFSSRAEAWHQAFALEQSELMKNGYSEQEAEAVRRFREVMYRGYQMIARQYDDLRFEIENNAGMDYDAYIRQDRNLFNVWTEFNKMGDWIGSYFPRIRVGKYFVNATKQVSSKTAASGKITLERRNVANSQIAAKMQVSKLRREGWTVSYEKNISGTSDLTLGQDINSLNAIMNRAVEGLDQFTNSDFLLNWNVAMSYRKSRKRRSFIVELTPLGGASAETRNFLIEIGGRLSPTGGYMYELPDGDSKSLNLEKFEKFLLNGIAKANNQMTMQETFSKVFQSLIGTVFMQGGSMARKLARDGKIGEEVVTGYEEDPLRVMSMYTRSLASARAKTQFAKDGSDAISGNWYTFAEYMLQEHPTEPFDPKFLPDYWKKKQLYTIDPKTQPNAYRYATVTWNELMRNEDAFGNIIGMLKGLASVYYLSRPASGLVNMLSIYTNVPAAIIKYTGVSGTKTVARVTRYTKRYWQYRLKGNDARISDRDKELLWMIRRFGFDSNTLAAESLAVSEYMIKKYAGKAQAFAMKIFGLTEASSRAAAVMAAYDALLDKEHGGIDPKTPEEKLELLKRAHEISNKALAEFTKQNRLHYTKGSWRILQPALLFMSYNINTFNLLLRNVEGVDQKDCLRCAAWWMMSSILIGGLKAAIPIALISSIIGMFGGDPDGSDDPEEWIAQNAATVFGLLDENGTMAGVLRTLLKRGGAGLLGFDIRGSLNPYDMFTIPTSDKELLEKFGGAGFNAAANFTRGIVDLASAPFNEAPGEKTMIGLERILPLVLSSPMKSVREHVYGVSTVSGDPVYWGDNRLFLGADKNFFQSYECYLRFFGFNPADIAEKRETQFKERRTKEQYTQIRKAIWEDVDRIVRSTGRFDPNTESGQRILERIADYNKRVLSKGYDASVANTIRKQDLVARVRQAKSAPPTEKSRMDNLPQKEKKRMLKDRAKRKQEADATKWPINKLLKR